MTKCSLLKKALAVALTILLSAEGIPIAASVDNNCNYIDQAEKLNFINEVTTSTTTFGDGFYVVDKNVTLSSTITVTGEAYLILGDGCILTITGSNNNAGIDVTDNNSLIICGQGGGNGTGKLQVTGGANGAGIGVRNESGGTGTVNIHSGIVTATGGQNGAGIGGDFSCDGGNVNIYGGVVTATGSLYGAGIGGGGNGSGGTVNVDGGTVTATAGEISIGYKGADIGSGGGKGLGSVSQGTCKITGGSVSVADMGPTPNNGSATVYLTKVKLEFVNNSAKITSLSISAEDYGTNDIYTNTSGYLCLYLPVGTTVTGAWMKTYYFDGLVTTLTSGQTVGKLCLPYELEYIDIYGYTRNLTESEVEIVTESTTTLGDRWYFVDSEVTLSSTITVTGNAYLILADGCNLTVIGSSNKAGIDVTDNNMLSIYGQINGTGKLQTTGGVNGAGIGVCYDYGDSGGTSAAEVGAVTIYGGVVTATGGENGAGIGGGFSCDGGNVNIFGGVVTAIGSLYGAGIGGGGNSGTGGRVYIGGGTVVATAGEISTGYKGADIGSGGAKVWSSVDQGTCHINGGSVKVINMRSVSYNDDRLLRMTTVMLQGVDTIADIAALTTNIGYYYGINDMKTDAEGKMYLWLPEGENTLTVKTPGNTATSTIKTYTGDIITSSAGGSGELNLVTGTNEFAFCITSTNTWADGNWNLRALIKNRFALINRACAVIAVYSASGNLLAVKSFDGNYYDEEEKEINLSFACDSVADKRYKVFVFDSSSSLRPLSTPFDSTKSL